VLKAIQDFFSQHLQNSSDSTDQTHRLHLASAALMIEVMRVDDREYQSEHQTLIESLQAKFSLSEQQTHELVELARQESGDATDYHQFTSLITRHFSPEQRELLLEYLWDIAYADGNLDRYEEHLLRKISDLLYLKHDAFIRSKLRAQAKLK